MENIMTLCYISHWFNFTLNTVSFWIPSILKDVMFTKQTFKKMHKEEMRAESREALESEQVNWSLEYRRLLLPSLPSWSLVEFIIAAYINHSFLPKIISRRLFTNEFWAKHLMLFSPTEGFYPACLIHGW